MKRGVALILATGMLFLGACSQQSEPKTINVLEKGVISGEGIDNSKALQKLFSRIANGTTLYFPEGVYEFESTIIITNKKNISIIGENAVLVRSGLDNTKQVTTERTAAFMINGCSNITMKGITVKHSGNTSVSGEIVNVNRLLGSVDIKPYDGFEVTGEELFNCLNTFDEKGIPDKRIENYSTETPYYIGPPKEDGSFTLLGLNDNELSAAQKGDKVCLRSVVAEYLFIIMNSNNMIFEDVTVSNSYDGAFLIGYHSQNATFRRLKIVPGTENALMSTNCDGIHISGLGGKLVLEDCEFYGLGDDCLNVHTTAGIVDKVSSNTVLFTTKYGYYDWAKKGDVIEFYDADTFTSLGTAQLKKLSNGKLTFDSVPEGVGKGTILSNKTLHPSVEIRGTKVHSNRARAFLLQTENVLVENCSFYGTALSAILIAPDIVYWQEVGPGKNITIKNNIFESCAKNAKGVVQLATSHDSEYSRYAAGVNENVTVEGNTFIDCDTSAVFAVSTRGLTVKNNDFNDEYQHTESTGYAVYVVNSEDVSVSGNRFLTPNNNLFGGENYSNITVE